MTSLSRRIVCFVVISALAACSSGGPQATNTTLLPTTSSQNVVTASGRNPHAIDLYLVIKTAGAFSNGSSSSGPCFGNPSGAIDILSFSFGTSPTAVVGPSTTCKNAPGGFTSTGPSTAGPAATLTPKNCSPYAVSQNGLTVGQFTYDIAANVRDPQCVALSNLPGATRSSAYGVNDAGTIVGYSGCKCGAKHPVEWVNNQIVPLSMGLGEAVGINKHGLIIGSVYDSHGNPTAAIWSGPNKVNLIGNLVPGQHLFGGQINDLGHATMYGAGGAYFYNGTTATKIPQMPGDTSVTPVGLDNVDVIYDVAVNVPDVKGKGGRASSSRLEMVSGGTATDMQTLVPANVTLLPNKIKTGSGGSGFTVSPGTGIIATPAQERIDGVRKPHALDTFMVFLIPPACVPPAYRHR